MIDQIDGEKIEQIFVPRFCLHRVQRMNDASPHQPIPQTVGNRAGKPAVLRMRHEFCEPGQPLFAVGSAIDASEFRKQPAGTGHSSGRLVTAMNFKRFFAVDRSETIGFVESPAVDEAVMTRRAFQVDPEK